MNTISLKNLKQEETSHKIVVKEHDIPMDTNSSSRKYGEFYSNFFSGNKVYNDQKKIKNLIYDIR